MKSTTLTPSKRKINNLDIADTYEDSKLYAKLSKEHPEGHVILNQQEKLILKSGLTYECRILQEF